MPEWKRAWSELEFLDQSDYSVDWGSVGVAAVGTIATAFFSGLANMVEAIWTNFIILPARLVGNQLGRFVWNLSTNLAVSPITNAYQPNRLVNDWGFVGALTVVALGGYLLAIVINEVVLDE